MHLPSLGTVRRTSPSRCAWLVALALLWAILSPQFIQALGTTGGTWVQVCSGWGTKLIQLDDSGATPASEDGKATSVATDCPYCRLHAWLALPPASAVRSEVPAAAFLAPVPPAPRAIPPHPPWRPALPRAPPAPTLA